MAKLTPAQLELSHAWLHDIFIWGGILPADKQKRTNYRLMYGAPKSIDGKPYAETICQAILNRKVDGKSFQEYDKALNILSNEVYGKDIHSVGYAEYVKTRSEILAKFIANFCKERNFIWDDSTASTYEQEEIKNNSILGHALYAFECFKSQQNNKTQTRTTSTRAAGQPPQNDYKTSGPKSGSIINIVGQPHQKLMAAGPISYCIESDKVGTGKNTPNAFVKPLDSKYQSNGANIICFGSGNGYSDCKCWFDDLNDANKFLMACQNKFGNKFTNIHVSKAKSDPNGYFVVKTEFGDCGIKASRLNEEIVEEKKPEVKYDNLFKVDQDNVDLYEDALFHEI